MNSIAWASRLLCGKRDMTTYESTEGDRHTAFHANVASERYLWTIKCIFALAPIVLAGGCATIPAGHFAYYLPRAETQLQITQTLSCNSSGTKLVQVLTTTPTTSYMSDPSAGLFTIQPSALSSGLSDVDVAISLTDDGRLSGINSSATGDGSAIVKDALAVAKAVGCVASAAPGSLYDAKTACATIAEFAPPPKADAKPGPVTVTLTYVVTFDYAKDSKSGSVQLLDITQTPPQAVASLQILPDASSVTLYNRLVGNIPRLRFDVGAASTTKSESGKWGGGSSGDVLITLNSVASVKLVVVGPVGDLQNADTIWSGQVQLPLTAKEDQFLLPIPKAATFGTRKLVLSLSAYGSINKLEYSTSGTSDAVDAAGAVGAAVAGTLKATTASQQASALQGQADLIYQQQRLAASRADPKTCVGK